MIKELVTPAIVVVVAIAVLIAAARAIAQPAVPELPPTLNVDRSGDWLEIRQEGYRTIHLRVAAITGMLAWPDHPATNRPGLSIVMGASEYRLDVNNLEQAEQITTLVTGAN